MTMPTPSVGREVRWWVRRLWRRWRVTIAFLAVVVVFFTLSVQERDARTLADQRSVADRASLHAQAVKLAREIRARQLYEYHNCVRARVNTQRINATARAQIRFLSQLEAAAPDRVELLNYIQIYRDSILRVPSCGRRPR